MARTTLLVLALLAATAVFGQAPPAPGVDPNPFEQPGNQPAEAPAEDPAAVPEDGAADAPAVEVEAGDGEEVDLKALGLEGVDIPEELQDLAPELQAQLLKIWPRTTPDEDGIFSMAFRQAEIADFLQFLADSTGYMFLVPPELVGKVTITAQEDVPTELAFEILSAWLAVNSHTMVRDDISRIVRVEPAKRSRTRGTLVGSGLDPEKLQGGDDYVTQVVMLETIGADAARDLISPMVDSEAGVVTASSAMNALVITDRADNVARIASVLRFLEEEVDQTEVHEVEVIKLEFADAQSVAQMLDSLFQQPQLTPQQIQQAIQRAGGDPTASLSLPGSGLIGTRGRVQVVADERTNSVVVLASRDKLDLINEILDQMDTSGEPEIKYRVFSVEYADAVEVAQALNEIWEQPRGTVSSGSMFSNFMSRGGGRRDEAFYGLKENVAVADIRTNKVVVTAAEENMAAFEKMIIALDKPKPLGDLTRVYKLRNADAETVANALNESMQGRQQGGGFLRFLFGGRANQGGPLDQLQNVSATPEPVTNQIIVTAPRQSFELVERMIEQLDQRAMQVFVRVVIADITLTDDDMFGVEWNWFAPNVAGGLGTTGDVDWGQISPDGQRQGMRWGVVSQNIQAFLSTLDRRGNVRVLSTPHIMVLDNWWGGISIGEQIPVLAGESESTSGRTTNTIEYKPASIALWVRPQINESGFITLDVRQSIDAVEESDGTVLGQPTFIRRQAQSLVSVKDAQTIIVGGILQSNHQKTEYKVPILHHLPVIGNLFEHERESNTRTELMVFMTPYIVVNEEDAASHTQEEVDRMSHPIPGLDVSPKLDTRWDVEDEPTDGDEASAEEGRRIRSGSRNGALSRG